MKIHSLHAALLHLAAAPALILSAGGCSLDTKGTLGEAADAGFDSFPDGAEADFHPPDGDVVIPPGCGNGDLEEGEQCDDGNSTNGDGCDNDCTFTCQVDGECSDGDICSGIETCSLPEHVCLPGTPREDGVVCANEPRSICLNGACRESTCGDGFTDTGAGEFCDPGSDPDCSNDCTSACGGDEDCPDDGNACNGEEYCDTGRHECSRRNAPPEGTVCAEEPRSICIAGTCQESVCGDAFTDAAIEECDDGNGMDGDGCNNDCTFSCRSDPDCDDDNPCNGVERCNTETHACETGIAAPSGTPCDDGLFCTPSDACDGSGNCIGSGDICADGLECTINESCDEETDQCSRDIADGYCLIGGYCFEDGDTYRSNPCLECRSAEEPESWLPKADMSECPGGRCCSGECRPDAQCCTDADCSGACTGEAHPCADFIDAGTCNAQTGCSWYEEGNCSGSYDCSSIDWWKALMCGACKCEYRDWRCRGGTRSCDVFPSRSECEGCEQCSWIVTFEECQGVHDPCNTYPDQDSCNGQGGCAWHPYTCLDFHCE